MSDTLVLFEKRGAVARIVLNRPDRRNALSRELIAQLTEAVQRAKQDAAVRMVVLAAEGPAFCAGMDLEEMRSRAADPNATAEWAQDARVFRDLMLAIHALSVPTLAVVQGPALAGGCGLVLACDLVIASTSAFFSLPEPQRGITAAIVTPLLVYRIGAGQGGYVLLSGRRVSADDALRIGLCHEVADSPERLVEMEAELCASVLTGAPGSLALTKRHLAACGGGSLEQLLEAGMKLSAEARQTTEAREGLAAFLEKRKPAWQ